ncbi:hypothetical protein HYPBUDRAFT_11421 [Hyphopichia burtonii NRRL Y-1933]|uniref:NAD(P)-binding protein n=1 Tax=Hyphopichia burtonii NRRL Y-1933 TaxID=984485 RepID=A0A1E4RHP3_9ASCO|nr:hypothetical protein HYPBUDRAFT_11421 [Hyphopichia burtonii NRRL Y-1933]ODV66778.1 hypothetical protein HYPBUDRAFT_11421 [Hyphopichia burtonii NRRL Y-1933]
MNKDSSFTWIPKKLSDLRLSVLIVGGTGGLGRAISRALLAAGADVTVVGRTFKDEDTKIKFVKADLSSIKESEKTAHELDVSNTDILLFTTGIFAANSRQETAEGLERDMATSYLNRLVMLRILVPKLKKTSALGFAPRVFLMGFPGNQQLGNINDLNLEGKYSMWQAHMTTVAGNEALIYDSVDKYQGVHFYGLNPGLVKTGIRNNLLGENSWVSSMIESLIGWFTPTPEGYADKISPILIAPELEKRNGGIFDNKGNALFPSKGMTTEYSKKFVTESETLLKNKGL